MVCFVGVDPDFPENLNVCVMADLFLKAKLAHGINVFFLKLDKRT